MSFLKGIGRAIGGAVKFLFGTAPSGATVVDKAATVLDEYKYTDEEKSKDIMQDTDAARAWQPPVVPRTPIELASMGFVGLSAYILLTLLDKIIDTLNHALRPGILVWLIGGLSGFWPLPSLSQVDPFWESILYLVFTFFYGGRMLLKDLPSFINAIRSLRTK